jgi:uncharacterized GH25 family protein
MRFLFTIFCFLHSLPFLCAQELWVQPDKYFYEPDDVARIELLQGKDFIGEPAAFLRDDVVALNVFYRNIQTDIRRKFNEGNNAFFTVDLSGEGNYQVMLESLPAKVEMSKQDFAELVRQYGLEESVDTTQSNGADTVSLSLRRYIKCYLRGGKEVDRRPEKVLGSPIEVIPDKNPLILKRGDRIVFTIFRNGKPAFGVRVKIWNRWNNRTTIQHIYTQQDGTVSTTISSLGEWMVSVMHVIKSESETDYIGESFNAVFGYR